MSDQWKAKRDHAVQVERARIASGESGWYQLCLKSVRTALGLPGGSASAKEAWAAVDKDDKYTAKIPPTGVPIFTDSPGGSKYGHIMLVLSNTKAKQTGNINDLVVGSNDILARGKISAVSLGYVLKHWGHVYLGWSSTLNGVRVAPKYPHDGGTADQ